MNELNQKKKILIIADSPLYRDPRVQVQINSLKGDYSLTCFGQASPKANGVAFHAIASPSSVLWKIRRRLWWKLEAGLRSLRLFSKAYFWRPQVRAVLRHGQRGSWDLILCNDIDMLPAAAKLSEIHKIPLYLDAHEYTPRQWDGDPKFQSFTGFWDYVMQEFSGKVDYMTTVCQSIADKYEAEYDLKSDAVVMNLPTAHPDLEPSDVDPDRIRIVHHGVLNRNRCLEVMINVMSQLDDRFSLDLYLVNTNPAYMKELVNLAKGNPAIRFRDPVPTAELPRMLNSYDMGIFPLEPLSTNYRFALPNKFFEFIQARLGIVIWPSVEMKKLLERHSLGVVTEDFDINQLGEALNSLTADQIRKFKENSHRLSSQLHSGASAELIRLGVEKCLTRE